MNIKKITITIDGPAASGKTSVGKKVADKLGLFFLDTGIMYRAVTLAALNLGIPISDEKSISSLAENIVIEINNPTKNDGRINDIFVNNRDVTWEIRDQKVNENVSQVSTYRRVRKAMTLQQRRIGEKGNIVMIGRDIGTVVMPRAEWKFFLSASPEERARRRLLEMNKNDKSITFESIIKSIRERDEIDSSRELAPLKPADDAIIIDTDGKNCDEVTNLIIRSIEDKEHFDV